MKTRMRASRTAMLATLLIGAASAQAPDSGEAARQLGAQANQQAAQAPNADPYTYPGYAGDNPPEKQYYNSGAAIQTQAQAAIAAAPASDPSKVVVNQATTGPQFTIAPNDPILTQGQTIASQAATLTQNYQGCQALGVQSPGVQYTTATCDVTEAPATATCANTLSTSCSGTEPSEPGLQAGSVATDMKWVYEFPTLTIGTIADNYWSGNCTIYERTTTFTIDDVSLLEKFELTKVGFDDYLYIAINGHVVYVGPYGGDMLAINGGAVQYDSKGMTGACELDTSWQKSPGVDVRPYLVNGVNTIDMKVEVASNGEGWMQFDAENYPDCSANDHWTQTCPSGTTITGCTLESAICTDGPGVKTIDGVPQYRDCWNQQQVYLCQSPQQQVQAACSQYLDQGCQQTGSACVAKDASGACTQYQETFRCPTASAGTNSVTLCGSDLYCPDGNCTTDLQTTAPSTSTQMAEASAYLQAAQSAATDNTNATGTISFFLGQGMKCSEAAVGFANCCSGSGWGTDTGLAQCSDEEQTLGVARQAGEAHEVGTYSTGSFVLKTTYEVFCVFNSMLSRIIQEQGRPQLGIGWGTPKNPDCRALTQDEMAALDFSKMDFSEFYATAEAQANAAMADMPTTEAIQQQLEQQLQTMTQNPGATSGTSGTTGP